MFDAMPEWRPPLHDAQSVEARMCGLVGEYECHVRDGKFAKSVDADIANAGAGRMATADTPQIGDHDGIDISAHPGQATGFDLRN